MAEIGFTDHVYRFTVARGWIDCDAWREEQTTQDLGRYVAAVGGARDDGLPVRLGMEVDWVPGQADAIAAALAGHDWDYLLGSYHWIGCREIDHPTNSVWDEVEPDTVWRTYVDEFCAAARSGLYDSMSHPDLAKVFGYRPGPEPLAEMYREMADAARDGGVCIEVSTAGLRKLVGEMYPAPALLARFAERDVPITLGADAHAPAGVGAALRSRAGAGRGRGLPHDHPSFAAVTAARCRCERVQPPDRPRPGAALRRGDRGRRPPHAGGLRRARWTSAPAPSVVIKAENLQRAGAFKFRGAYTALSALDPGARAAGVVAFSSGNHAQAVALAGAAAGRRGRRS